MIQASVQPDKIKDNELFSQMKYDMVKAHMQYLLFHIFVQEIEEAKFTDARIKPILQELARVHALKQLKEDMSAAYSSGFFAPEADLNINVVLNQTIVRLRP